MLANKTTFYFPLNKVMPTKQIIITLKGGHAILSPPQQHAHPQNSIPHGLGKKRGGIQPGRDDDRKSIERVVDKVNEKLVWP